MSNRVGHHFSQEARRADGPPYGVLQVRVPLNTRVLTEEILVLA